MPFSETAARKHLHTRQVICEGFARDDGLWDIEGRLIDTKTYGFHNHWRGDVPAGTSVHEMHVRLTLDDKFTVMAVEVLMPAAPFRGCSSIEPNFEPLVGQSVGPGWNRRVAELVGGTKGCTHVTEVLGRMAMAAFQTIPIERLRRAREAAKTDPELAKKMRAGMKSKPYFIDGCHTWQSSGPVVEKQFPEFYTGGNEPEQT